MLFKQRAQEAEQIDLGPAHYTPAEYADCLRQLGRIGRYLGGDRATLKAIDESVHAPDSILDVGCGGGQFTKRLAERYPNATVVGIDLDPQAIQYAKSQPNLPANVRYELRDHPQLLEPTKSYDLVVATLVCHHLTDADIPDFLGQACRVARRAVIINDLHRHPLAWLGFAAIAPWLFPNRLILRDGLLSIRKGFRRDDWARYLANRPYQLQWKWPFRWLVKVQP